MNMDYLRYEDFGAKGDGKNDDLQAIIACHEEANRLGLPVKANDDATYYIGPSAKCAYIKTDVDFGKAKIVIDDRNVEEITSYIFTVASDYECFTPDIKNLSKGQTHIDLPHEGNIYVRVFDDNKKIFIRKGLNMNNGTATSDCFIIDEKGNISPSVDWDYPTITRAFARRTDDKPITIKGGIFTTIANQAASFYTYYKRGFCINRSHVTVTDVEHYVTGELDHGAPYHGFYYVKDCIDVTIKNAILTPRFIYYTASKIEGRDVPMGSYDLSFHASIDVRCINIKHSIDFLDTKYWGIYTSNFCKNLLIEDCTLSRFDAHQGVTNATIRRCQIGHQQIKLIGFGEALIEDTMLHGSGTFIELRGDYGSIWDGNLTIRNCSWIPSNPDCSLINGWNSGDHDYGYDCYMPHRIEIDGFKVLNGKHKDAPNVLVNILGVYDKEYFSGKPYPYYPTEELIVKNFEVEAGDGYGISKNMELYKNLTVKKQ